MKEKIIKQIWFARKKAGYNQSQMAIKMGVTPTTYSKMETGKNVSSHLFWAVLDFFNIKTIE